MIPFIRHKTASMNDGLPGISKMKYRNRIPEPGTTISVLPIMKKTINPDRPTLDFFGHVTVNTPMFFFGLNEKFSSKTFQC